MCFKCPRLNLPLAQLHKKKKQDMHGCCLVNYLFKQVNIIGYVSVLSDKARLV